MSTPKEAVRTRKIKRNPKAHRNSAIQLPDISEIVYALSDASALVTVASNAVMDGRSGPEATVLRIGVAALEKAMDLLERAELKVAAFLTL